MGDMRTSDVIKSYLGLLCLGMSDYDAVENFRRDKPFQQLLTLQKVPSAATLRQRLEKLAANDLQARTATWSTTLLSLIEAPITAETPSFFELLLSMTKVSMSRQTCVVSAVIGASISDSRVVDQVAVRACRSLAASLACGNAAT